MQGENGSDGGRGPIGPKGLSVSDIDFVGNNLLFIVAVLFLYFVSFSVICRVNVVMMDLQVDLEQPETRWEAKKREALSLMSSLFVT